MPVYCRHLVVVLCFRPHVLCLFRYSNVPMSSVCLFNCGPNLLLVLFFVLSTLLLLYTAILREDGRRVVALPFLQWQLWSIHACVVFVFAHNRLGFFAVRHMKAPCLPIEAHKHPHTYTGMQSEVRRSALWMGSVGEDDHISRKNCTQTASCRILHTDTSAIVQTISFSPVMIPNDNRNRYPVTIVIWL